MRTTLPSRGSTRKTALWSAIATQTEPSPVAIVVVQRLVFVSVPSPCSDRGRAVSPSNRQSTLGGPATKVPVPAVQSEWSANATRRSFWPMSCLAIGARDAGPTFTTSSSRSESQTAPPPKETSIGAQQAGPFARPTIFSDRGSIFRSAALPTQIAPPSVATEYEPAGVGGK